MKSDIPTQPVTDVAVAAAPRPGTPGEEMWDIYLVNLGEEPITNILITSQGYGMLDGKDKTTTVLRHFHPELAARASLKIEPIQSELFGITNEYWVSFNRGAGMMDKKYVFRPGQISPELLVKVPVLERAGVYKQ